MNHTQFVFTLSVAIISGLLSGTLSVWFLMPQGVLAQGGPPKVIEAQEFRVVDEDGNTRATLGGPLLGSSLRLTAPDGEAFISTSGINFTGSGIATSLGPGFLNMQKDDGSTFGGKSRVDITYGDPSIRLTDDEGFQAVLGSTGTVERRTGRTNQTSAASLILFGKDGTAIWSAP